MIEYILFVVILLTRAVTAKNKYLNSLLDFSNYISLYFLSTYTYTYLKTIDTNNIIQLLSYFVFVAFLITACRYFDKMLSVFKRIFNDSCSTLLSVFYTLLFAPMFLYSNSLLFLLMWLVFVLLVERFYYN